MLQALRACEAQDLEPGSSAPPCVLASAPPLQGACPAMSGPATADATNDVLFGTVYARLKALASRQIERNGATTLDTTALVHELYLRMAGRDTFAPSEVARFFGYAAKAMRNILTDRARHRLAQKSGGDWLRVTLGAYQDAEQARDEVAVDVLALDEAIASLEAEDARAAEVVQLRYFAGLTLEQVAEVMDLNRRTITRDWNFARAFLRTRLG